VQIAPVADDLVLQKSGEVLSQPFFELSRPLAWHIAVNTRSARRNCRRADAVLEQPLSTNGR